MFFNFFFFFNERTHMCLLIQELHLKFQGINARNSMPLNWVYC